jgi:Holliday junction resolvase
MNSRQKGKRGELEFSKFLAAHGFPARRGQQFAGGNDSPDVVCESLKAFHIEVKRCERGNLYDWLEQARRDAQDGQIPTVYHRRNDSPWVSIRYAEDDMTIIRRTDFLA